MEFSASSARTVDLNWSSVIDPLLAGQATTNNPSPIPLPRLVPDDHFLEAPRIPFNQQNLMRAPQQERDEFLEKINALNLGDPVDLEILISEYISNSSNTRVQAAIVAALDLHPELFIQLRPAGLGQLPSLPFICELQRVSPLSNDFELIGSGFGELHLGESEGFFWGKINSRPSLRDHLNMEPRFDSSPLRPGGIGVRSYPNGVRQVGTFDGLGRLQGPGIVVNSRGFLSTTFVNGVGGGQNNRKPQQGQFFFNNGDFFEGKYVHGKAQGRGTYTSNNGERVTGWFFCGYLQNDPKPEFDVHPGFSGGQKVSLNEDGPQSRVIGDHLLDGSLRQKKLTPELFELFAPRNFLQQKVQQKVTSTQERADANIEGCRGQSKWNPLKEQMYSRSKEFGETARVFPPSLTRPIPLRHAQTYFLGPNPGIKVAQGDSGKKKK